MKKLRVKSTSQELNQDMFLKFLQFFHKCVNLFLKTYVLELIKEFRFEVHFCKELYLNYVFPRGFRIFLHLNNNEI